MVDKKDIVKKYHYEREARKMRIDAYNTINRIYQTKEATSVNKTKGAEKSNDKFEISQTAQSYQTAKKAVNNASDVREDKVSLIKAQLSAGTYQVSSEDVADKILDNAETLSF